MTTTLEPQEKSPYPLRFKGVEWVRDGETLQKSIIRVFQGTKKAQRSRVTVVAENAVFCGGCLSSNVHFDHAAGASQCLDCHAWFDAPTVTP